MSWWGKIVGGTFGFMLGGPLGAMLGAAVGHSFDRGLKTDGAQKSFGGNPDQERIQSAFFTAVFSVMGYIAKADGRVTADEIATAEAVMAQMALSAEQKRVAIDLFNQGKQPTFEFAAVMNQFKRECRRRTTLFQMFLEILLHAAYADGVLHANEASILRQINRDLGFSERHFEQIESLVRAQRFFTGENPQNDHIDPQTQLKDAYALLGVANNHTDAEVKKAYRRAMNQHHPDKLIAKGLPEEMVKLATTKTQEIKAAYDLIKKHRTK